MQQLLEQAHPDWQEMVTNALTTVDNNYLRQLQQESGWLPGWGRIFAAFSQPIPTRPFILLGESPYPRAQSANGYAFWDEAVQALWSSSGLSKQVNRATSLRNIIKMLLLTRGDLTVQDTSQTAIAALDKTHYWHTAAQFFTGMLKQGFVLLNATLVYHEGEVAYHAKHWRPFLDSLLEQLVQSRPQTQLVLFGKIAALLGNTKRFACVVAEHPYNLSFIHNKAVHDFFKPFDLLRRYD